MVTRIAQVPASPSFTKIFSFRANLSFIMPTQATVFAILAAMASLPLFSLATWEPGKAVQINFYANAMGGQYDGEVAAWWTRPPLAGSPGLQAECIALNMPSNSQSANLAAVWEPSTGNTATEAAPASGSCTFYGGATCTGNVATTNYTPGSGTLLTATSTGGIMWKSAKCWTRISTNSWCCSSPKGNIQVLSSIHPRV
jgi:hypothetical protein